MRDNNRNNPNYKKHSPAVGVLYTLGFHVILFSLFFSTGLKTVYPPPPEQGVLIEFEQEEEVPIEVKPSNEPRARRSNPDEEIRLVQRSESQLVAESGTAGVETTMGEDGDVEVPEPVRPKEIDRRALFSAADNKRDTLAAQVSEKISESLTAGHRDGNTRVGNTDDEPSARLEGRSVMGSLPIPDYSVQESGRVIVKILVDQYGNVTNAIPGSKGTTVQDSKLWEAAKQAAMKAKFNLSETAPPVQEGTITYDFTYNVKRQ